MISLHTIILLLGLIAAALACAPHMPKRNPTRGYCKFYIDGSSDYESARKKRDSSSSSSSGSSESSGGSKGGSGGGGGGGKNKFNRSKKKNTKCYEYEDGSKDDGAVLNKGVKYTVVVTRDDPDVPVKTTTVKPKEVKHGLCVFYVDGTSDITSGRKKRAAASKVFTTTKKKPSTKCYEYQDGTKDAGAVLDKGVTYTVTVTKEVIE